MLILASEPQRMGVSEHEARVRIGPADPSTPSSARQLFVDGDAAFELSFWCGSCQFLFERAYGANHTLSADREPLTRLEDGVDLIDDQLLAAFSLLLVDGDYLPLLIEIQPQLVAPHDQRDYFAHEQVDTWGLETFWGLPENPRSYYYRTFETAVPSPGRAPAHLYEFVVPMVPPSWNDRSRVRHYRDLIGQGGVPTAVALSTLDVCQPAIDDGSADYYAHWGLTHFLLDGHHKLEAAAAESKAIRLLSLVSLAGSLAGAAEIARLPELLSRPRQSRPAGVDDQLVTDRVGLGDSGR